MNLTLRMHGLRVRVSDDQHWLSEPRVQGGSEAGQWTSGGGGGGGSWGKGAKVFSGKSGGKPPTKGSEPGAEAPRSHPTNASEREALGHGYSREATVTNGVVHTSSVYDAARALYEGRKVELHHVREVSTLIKHLGDVAARMIRLGEKAPTFNLCDVAVEGTNLFCAESKGIPRVKMPQLDKAQTEAFIKSLIKEGYKAEQTTEESDHLKATQDELNGAKVAAIAAHYDPEKGGRTIVSRDNYILDGHHRWAAQIGLDAIDDKFTNVTKITRIDISIADLLRKADDFTGGKGHQGVEVSLEAEEAAKAGKAKDEAWENEPRIAKGSAGGGQWTGGGGGGSSSEGESRIPRGKNTAAETQFVTASGIQSYKQFGVEGISGGDVEVAINPTQDEIEKIGREDPYNFIRLARLRDGTVLAWGGQQAIHDDIVDSLKSAGKIKTVGFERAEFKYDPKKRTLLTGYVDEEDQGDLHKPEAKWFRPTGGEAEEMVSPNVATNMDFGQAVNALTSKRHKDMRQAAEEVDEGLGLKSREEDAIGAWSDGAEDSVCATVGRPDWAMLKAAAAMKGWLGNQKSVLAFMAQHNGPDLMLSFMVPPKQKPDWRHTPVKPDDPDAWKFTKDPHEPNEDQRAIADIHDQLLQLGVKFHTLVPTEKGVRVMALDTDGSVITAMEKAAKDYGASVRYVEGKSEFVGTSKEDGSDAEQRADARSQYQRVIESSQSPRLSPGEAATVWAGLRDKWSGILEATEALKPESNPAEQWKSEGKPIPLMGQSGAAVGGAGGLSTWQKQSQEEHAKAMRARMGEPEPADKSATEPLPNEAPTEEEEEDRGTPQDWSEVPEEDQERAKQNWIEGAWDAEVEYRRNDWMENVAPEQAPGAVVDDFNDANDNEWADTALADNLHFADDPEDSSGEKPTVPFTRVQVMHALSLDRLNDELNIKIDDDMLGTPVGWGQNEALPGLTAEAEKPADRLTDKMRDQIKVALTEAFEAKVQDWIEKQDYEPEADEIQESLDDSWESMDDSDKLRIAARFI